MLEPRYRIYSVPGTTTFVQGLSFPPAILFFRLFSRQGKFPDDSWLPSTPFMIPRRHSDFSHFPLTQRRPLPPLASSPLSLSTKSRTFAKCSQPYDSPLNPPMFWLFLAFSVPPPLSPPSHYGITFTTDLSLLRSLFESSQYFDPWMRLASGHLRVFFTDRLSFPKPHRALDVITGFSLDNSPGSFFLPTAFFTRSCMTIFLLFAGACSALDSSIPPSLAPVTRFLCSF